ncbi:MAG: hypothetical protein H6Q11_1236, partial [Acidobacteria bacterium]|nr:hypothetical protein [Acidobacteriota bacterium]
MATVALLGTLDTKGAEYGFLREQVRAAGCETVLIDAGIMGEPPLAPDITRQQVAAAAGEDVAALAAAGDRGAAVAAMARGAAEILSGLFAGGRLHGLLGMGGSGATSLVGLASRVLPVGVPKLIVSTVASGNTRAYVGTSDLALMYSVVDIAGINSVSERVLGNAAAAVAGMARHYAGFEPRFGGKPCVGATMFGVTTPCVTVARQFLEEHGYEVLVFHATGVGGMSMEALMRSGLITGVLDVTTAELADELAGGVLAAGPDRLEVAGGLGLPQVVTLGGLDIVNFGPADTVPERYRGRNLYRHNPAVTLMRTSREECAALGRRIAAKLNRASGPLTVFIPHRGMSSIGTTGGVFHDPQADAALISELRAGLDPRVEVVEMDTDINAPAFARALAQRLHEHYQAWQARVQTGSTAAGKEESADAEAGGPGRPHAF